MSDPGSDFKKGYVSANDMFGPARASMRTHFGEFMDVYMGAKIEVVRKLASVINLESDPKKLMELRGMLNDVMFSESDIEQLDGKIKALMDMLKTHATSFLALKQQVRSALRDEHDPHRRHS